MANPDTYDVAELIVLVGGSRITGFDEGDILTIVRDSAVFDDMIGADGRMVRFKTNDDRVTIEINMLQTAPANAVLDAILTLDKSTPNGAGILPVTIQDGNGISIYEAASAWISGPPDVTYASGPKTRTWKIRGVLDARIDGGN